MIRLRRGWVEAALSRSVYSRESLRAGALALGERARVYLIEEPGVFRAEIRPSAKRLSAARLRGLAGEFLNEALSHQYRQKVVRFNRALSAAALSRVFARGFKAACEDPLEELEPRVREDRRQELAALLAAARGAG